MRSELRGRTETEASATSERRGGHQDPVSGTFSLRMDYAQRQLAGSRSWLVYGVVAIMPTGRLRSPSLLNSGDRDAGPIVAECPRSTLRVTARLEEAELGRMHCVRFIVRANAVPDKERVGKIVNHALPRRDFLQLPPQRNFS